MRLSLIPRFAEILGLPARPAVQALRCRALTTGKSIGAVRRVRKRSVSLQKPPEASFQGCQVFIGLINVCGAATEESTAANVAGQAPGKTVAIAERSALSTDFPLRAERYPSASLCQVFDPVKASLTDAIDEAATPQ